MNIEIAWGRVLMECEACFNYFRPYELIIGWAFKNPLVEHMFPSILLVKATSVFDEALEYYIDTVHGGLPAKYRRSLDGRIRFLDDNKLTASAADLHLVRDRRNKVAHESDNVVSWNDLVKAIDTMEGEMISLNILTRPKKYEYFGNRSEITLSTDPGVLGTRVFTFGIKENGVTALEKNWTQTLHRLDKKASGLD